MDLRGRMDPEVAQAFPHLRVLDLNDIPTARTTLLDLLAESNATVEASDDVVPEFRS